MSSPPDLPDDVHLFSPEILKFGDVRTQKSPNNYLKFSVPVSNLDRIGGTPRYLMMVSLLQLSRANGDELKVPVDVATPFDGECRIEIENYPDGYIMRVLDPPDDE